ncbi:PREDICTED: nuclear factor erythroid 2-related factor 3 isoform X1 [Pseudopodoces humilis]|uniref:nuclear factor erythroid 2-related factor 3 isoform X1 n=1 Tax=Pseudopodoces humilis TaxID=181119 RepID=UPI000395AD4A|nr:PREDICTED: nuclear factor erythroid 2-related factor 3 isoform X1 [Pseudopodoces humilis]
MGNVYMEVMGNRVAITIQDVDLKACQGALGDCCPPQGEDQLELQEEEEKDINQSNSNHVDSLLSLEGYLQLLSSQVENMLEVNLLEDTQVATSSKDQDPSSSDHNINLTQKLQNSFGPPDAMLLGTDYPTQLNSKPRHLQRQEFFPQSSSGITNPESLFHGSNLTGLFSAADIRNQTAHDDSFDEIKLMSLALEEGFSPIEVSQMFEEPGSDLGPSLNSNHCTTSYSICCEDSVWYSSGVKSAPSHGLGAVGGHCQENIKHSHMEYPGDTECSAEATLQQFLQNHTYNQLPSQTASTPQHHQQMWMKKSNEVKDRCHNSTATNRSRDECRAKALRIPFSVDEIASMSVDSFNAMLAKNQLTETQVSLLRDIRRRGKNKVAAQKCRKRKLNAILNLEEDVCNLQTQKETLKKEHSQCSKSINQIKQKLNYLYHEIFSKLRDDQGRPVNPCQYVIHCSSSGSVFLMPKHLAKSEQKQENRKEQKQK